jgi:hypothetical protein
LSLRSDCNKTWLSVSRSPIASGYRSLLKHARFLFSRCYLFLKLFFETILLTWTFKVMPIFLNQFVCYFLNQSLRNYFIFILRKPRCLPAMFEFILWIYYFWF